MYDKQTDNNVKMLAGFHYPMDVYWQNRKNGGITELVLDMSSRCNYQCDWCCNMHLINNPEPDLLDFSERCLVLQDARRLGARTFVAVGAGEPTLDPDFFKLVEEANKIGLSTVLYSNITGNINKNNVRLLYEMNTSIVIKLDSLNIQYFKNRNHTDDHTFYLFLRNLFYILETYRDTVKIEIRNGKQHEIHRVAGNMVITRENLSELPHIAQFCADLGLPLFLRPVRPVYWASTNPHLWEELGNSKGDGRPEIAIVEAAKSFNTLFCPSSTPENHCAIYSFGLVLRGNGDVQSCPDNESTRGTLGNIRNNSMREIISKLNLSRVIKPGFCDMLPDVDHNNNTQQCDF